MRRNSVSPEIEARVMNHLKTRGYRLTQSAKLTGQSGVEHVFDLLAETEGHFVSDSIVISFIPQGQKAAITNAIFNFSKQAGDVTVNRRILVVAENTDNHIKELAGQKQVKIIDYRQIESIDQKLAPFQPYIGVKENLPVESREQLTKLLVQHGYNVPEDARLKGNSGIDYTFGLLAEYDVDYFGYRIGIDFLDRAPDIKLEQLSFIYTMAMDTGIDYEAIAVKSKLSAEADTFSKMQNIQVFQIKAVAAPKVNISAEVNGKPPIVKTGPLFPQPNALQLIPEIIARRYNAVPLSISGDMLEVAVVDTNDMMTQEALAAISQKKITAVATSKKEIREAIDLFYEENSEMERQLTHINIPTGNIDDGILATKIASSTPVVDALNMIIEGAGKARASDIHLEPTENRLRVRYRIDGELQDMISLPLGIHRALVSRTKVLVGMNIADSLRPQDGQFTTMTRGRSLDIRVSTIPSIYGETAVLRILDKSMALMELSDLGFLPGALAKYEKMLKIPYGMILISGPTGSGKTTTLYATVNTLDSMKRKIVTVEDPAEYRLKDITQIQVNQQAGITFVTGLRSILRLDPDIIFIGEIRDGETAGIAVQAAQTGHTVLSSIHASDTTGVLSRLVDLEVEPFIIASSVVGIVSQRLVRRVCPHCQHMIEATVLEQIAYEEETGEKQTEFAFGLGCKKCSYIGYLGRIGIYEVLAMSNTIKAMLYHGASADEMRRQALKDGMITMLNDGMQKVKLGITTPSEVVRAAYIASFDR